MIGCARQDRRRVAAGRRAGPRAGGPRQRFTAPLDLFLSRRCPAWPRNRKGGEEARALLTSHAGLLQRVTSCRRRNRMQPRESGLAAPCTPLKGLPGAPQLGSWPELCASWKLESAANMSGRHGSCLPRPRPPYAAACGSAEQIWGRPLLHLERTARAAAGPHSSESTKRMWQPRSTPIKATEAWAGGRVHEGRVAKRSGQGRAKRMHARKN